MPDFDIIRKTDLKHSFRVDAIIGKFDVPRTDVEFKIQGTLPEINEEWNIGVIYGASGSGKTLIATECYGDPIMLSWDKTPIVENFNKEKTVEEITESLSSVGFNSIPKWLLPYSSLSNGQKFRADMARVICENEFAVIDEFTSVVDRDVAKSVSLSVSKFIKRKKRKLILISCHSDILEWLEPDWVFYTENSRLARDCLRRPKFRIAITRGSISKWKYFKDNHYMTGEISPTAKVYFCYVELGGKWDLVGFFSTMPAMGMKGWDRGHRTVVLPDFQGLGIGNRMIEETAEWLWESSKRRFRATTSAIPIIKHRLKNQHKWKCVQKPVMKPASKSGVKTSVGRLTSSWIYIPVEMRK